MPRRMRSENKRLGQDRLSREVQEDGGGNAEGS